MGEIPRSLTTYSITLKVKWQREPPLSTQWRRQRQQQPGCLQPPGAPPLEAVIIFRFDVITVGANLHVDCRLSGPQTEPTAPDPRSTTLSALAEEKLQWMLAFRKAEREPRASVVMQRLSYPTETVLSPEITKNRIALSFKDSPRKP